jgi:hypothetical protein
VQGSVAHTGWHVVTGTFTQQARYVVCGTYCVQQGVGQGAAQGLAHGLQHVLQPPP